MRGAPEELRENSSTCAEKGLLSQFGAWICPMLPFELSPLDSGIWASSVLAFELRHLDLPVFWPLGFGIRHWLGGLAAGHYASLDDLH